MHTHTHTRTGKLKNKIRKERKKFHSSSKNYDDAFANDCPFFMRYCQLSQEGQLSIINGILHGGLKGSSSIYEGLA